MHFFPMLGRMAQPRTSQAPPSLGIPLTRVKGIQIAIDPSWFVIIVFMTLMLNISWRDDLGMSPSGYLWFGATLSSLAFFACVLAHELSHSLVARARGITVEGIVLFIFGGVSRLRSEPTRPKDEIVIALVGPLTSLVIGGLFMLAWALVPQPYLVTRMSLAWL